MLFHARSERRRYELGPYPLEALHRDAAILETEAARPRLRAPLPDRDPIGPLAKSLRNYLKIFIDNSEGVAAEKLAPSQVCASTCLLLSLTVASMAADSKLVEMQVLEGLAIDKTEVTVEQFALYAKNTGIVTKAEEGGGLVYEGGWLRKEGWNWRTPFGTKAKGDEPAVHITFDEASAYCKWAGKRLPTEIEWIESAYTEQRIDPQPPFETGETYTYPTGTNPEGANCLDDCGPTTAIDYSSVLTRGVGHAPVATTRPGVNGLYDMGANVWEWVRSGDGASQGTLGGSWWYGQMRMRNGHRATKPRDMAVVYIGFRCVKDLD